MQSSHIWKSLSILAILALCVLSLYPPSQKLKPGLDLAGGTTLIYEVNVPPDKDSNTVIEQTIATLRSRVDPNGVRNLIWRRQGGNRIEIQMALAPKETAELRTKYLGIRDEVVKGNISARELAAALRLPSEQRNASLDGLAAGNSAMRASLEELAKAHDGLEAASGPYQTLQKELIQAQESFKRLSTDNTTQPSAAKAVGAGSTTQANDLKAHIAEIQDDLIVKTRAYLQARKLYTEAEQAVLSSNIDPAELERVLALSDVPVANPDHPGQPGVSPRPAAIQHLIEQHPQKADEIHKVVDAFNRYDKVRGPLDDPNDLIALLRGSGVLEFRIAPSPDKVPDLDQYRDQLRQRGPRGGADKSFRWFQIDDPKQFSHGTEQLRAMEANTEGFFASQGLVGQAYGGQYYLLLSNTSDSSMTHAQPGWKLTNAGRTQDQMGFPAVSFTLNAVGGQLMGQLTANHLKQPMAIVLDGKIKSAPTIQSRISDQGQISGGSGGFSPKEMTYLILTLNAGSLEGSLSENPISIKTTGPQLGADNLHAGLKALIYSLIAVGGFMAVYYLFWGMVANFALVANLLIVLGVMAALEATFTLPGIAGLVLTIGMSVDANVLIFERIREELERKADLRTAVRLGFQKALATIIDSNLTTLISCIILGYTATADVKGFAITLGIGLVANVFTGVFCSHVLIDLYLDIFKPKSLTMLPLAIPAIRRLLSPNIDWMGKRHVFYASSLIVILAGLVAIYARGGEILDIEFRAGTQVGFELAPGKTLTLHDVRERLNAIAAKTGMSELRGDRATVVTVGDTQGTAAHAFSIATLETDSTKVSDAVKTAFADILSVDRPIAFKGAQVKEVTGAPVYKVDKASLGEVINRPEVQDDVSDYLGGVAIVLQDMDPAQTVDQLTERIRRMRMQPPYDELGYRQFTVIGLDMATSTAASAAGDDDAVKPHYRSAVVVSHDSETNYVDNPDTFGETTGFAQTEWTLIKDALQRETSLQSVSNFSSQISDTMKQQAITAMVLSLLAIGAYLWFRFGNVRYGMAAIISLIHDVLIALGLAVMAHYVYDTPVGRALYLSDFKVNIALVAALLTLVGYSINDTIVLFDRIRENRGRLAFATRQIINDSVNQTMSRTVLTSGTVLIAVTILYIVGGEGVKGFAFIMIIGSLVGVYSSFAIAAPLLLVGLTESSDSSGKPQEKAGKNKATVATK